MGVRGEFTTPLPLPIHMTPSCGPLAYSDLMLQKVEPDYITMEFTAFAQSGLNPDDPSTSITAGTYAGAEGRIGPGVYTVEINPTVIFSPTFSNQRAGYSFWLREPGHNPYPQIRCYWTDGNPDPSGCSVPVSLEIVIPEGITKQWYFDVFSYSTSSPAIVTISGQVFSIKKK